MTSVSNTPHIPDLATCKKIGFIVPSSNTAVEPISQAILNSLDDNIICIFTRIKVTTVGLDRSSREQFNTSVFVEAAKLLADAQPDVILWNGTSGQWNGASLEGEVVLAEAMQKATGIPCSTTTLATINALESVGVMQRSSEKADNARKSVSIAVPYSAEHTAAVGDFFRTLGYHVSKAETLHSTPPTNNAIAMSNLDDIRAVVRQCAGPSVHAVVISCTNWPGSGLAAELEAELGCIIIDSITVTVWWALRMLGCKKKISGWGRLFQEQP